MSNAKHTPGPWKIEGYYPHSNIALPASKLHFAVRDEHSNVMALTGGVGEADHYESEANAALIAAAPELLAALETCLRNSELRRTSGVESGPVIEREIETARAAIAKATGN